MSLDRQPVNSRLGEGAPKSRNANSESVRELERPASRSSVNFSRPMSPQNSPPQTPLVGGRVRSPPPSKSSGSSKLPDAEVARILDSIQEAGTAPAKKKKKAAAKDPVKGRDPAAGLASIPSQGMPAPAESQPQHPPVSTKMSPSTVAMPVGVKELPISKKKRKKASSAVGSQDQDAGGASGSGYPSDTDSVTSERSTSDEKPRSYNTRAGGLLMKQPSIVREDREAEEEEESRLPAKKMNGQVGKVGKASGAIPANTSKLASKGAQNNKGAGQAHTPSTTERSSLDVPGTGSHQSLSPARSTHFSSQPEYETAGGIKHQPPARSVSPAKSALKYSPSRGQSPVGSLPATWRGGFAGSEASDTASNISDDGPRSIPKKKRPMRVSFDDESVVVGRAASPPLSPDSPVIMSPQNKPKGRSWFDLVREKKQEEAIVDPDHNSVMKPTPTLPSFGSVRRDRAEEPKLDTPGDQELDKDNARDTLRGIGTSSDQVLGAVISQDAADRADTKGPQSTDPLPPEVTSVEGSGYHSDEEMDHLDHQPEKNISEVRDEAFQDASGPTNRNLTSSEFPSQKFGSIEQDTPVPSIALQPATPGLETGSQEQKGWLGMPGDFPNFTQASDSIHPQTVPTIEHHSLEVTPVTVGLAEPEPAAAAVHHDPGTTHLGGVSEGLRTQIESHSGDESDETGGSIYSDAAEEPDDLDGDGFGSINAIVESPAPSPVVPVAGRSPPASPSMKANLGVTTIHSPLAKNENVPAEPASEEGWDRAQAYWSGLSQERRRQLEYAAVPGAPNERVMPSKTMRGPDSVKRMKKKKAQNSPSSPTGSNNPGLPLGPDKQYHGGVTRPAAPIEPPLKSSLRNPQTGDTRELHIRSSMRNKIPPKSSLRNESQRTSVHLPVPEPRGALQKKHRPMSAVAMADYNSSQAASAPGHIRASSAGVPPSSVTPVLAQPKKKARPKGPVLQRNDSDSSTSFKRERPSTPASGKYTMKRTMRPSSADSREPGGHAGSMAARNTSLTGPPIRRPFGTASPGGGNMRTSMRDSVDSSKPTTRTSLRESMDSKTSKPPSRFGFGKSSKPKAGDSKPNSRFPSRFGDSSDEEETMPTQNSRFADSSDDEPAGLTPVRGIPRRIDEGDSTDLEDSSPENTPTPSKAKVNGTKPSLDTKPEGVVLASGSLRVASGDGSTAAMGAGLQAKKAAEKDKKKRSFFGSLGSKKRDDPSRVREANIESPARRDTPLERSKTERLLTTGTPKDERVLGPSSPTADPVARAGRPPINSRTSSTQNSPKSPKLQRRNTPKTLTSANGVSWPLPKTPNGIPNSRPRTSDGAVVSNGPGRPDLGTRRTTVQDSLTPQKAPLTEGKAEKKKRFGMLRKAFGMQN